ncbi:helix-turn-helix transcriptional regulator [Microbacterium sp.]|uniref:helix-turn-helix transcriptional regulator n=1 Tax=Microbacterium sp. TaxID=51671 RepID=UPI003A942F65
MGKKKDSKKKVASVADVIELPTLLTKEQIADYFGVSPRTVEAWRFNTVGPPAVKVGKHLRWTAGTIRKYVFDQLADSAQAS